MTTKVKPTATRQVRPPQPKKGPRSIEKVIKDAPLTKAIGRALGAKTPSKSELNKINTANAKRRHTVQRALGRPVK